MVAAVAGYPAQGRIAPALFCGASRIGLPVRLPVRQTGSKQTVMNINPCVPLDATVSKAVTKGKKDKKYQGKM